MADEYLINNIADLQPTTEISDIQSSDSDNNVDRLMSGRLKLQNELETQIKKLRDSYLARQNTPLPSENLPFNPALMQLAAGFLAPTKTGSFGESLGMAAQGYTEAARELAKEREARDIRNLQDLEGVFKLTQMQGEMNKQNLVNELSSRAITPTTDSAGNVTYKFDPKAATQLAKLTGDTKYIDKIIEQQKADKKRIAQQNMFISEKIPGDDKTPEKIVYKPNPEAISKILATSDNPSEDLAAFSKNVTELRKSGLLSGVTDASSPFDAIALLTNDPAFKSQAQRLAKQYANGMIDEDHANSLAQQMMTMITSHMDRQQAANFNQMMQQMMFGLRQDNLRFQQEAKSEEQNKKLSDEQKISYRNIIVPIINQGAKATDALATVDSLRSAIDNAPSGFISGYYNKTLGKWMGTDANEALRELEMQSKRLMTLIPRLPGAQSNFDAQNLEKSLGQLQDPTLTNENRRKLLNKVEEGFKSLQNRAYEAQDYWEENKKISPSLLGRKTEDGEKQESVDALAKSAFGSYEPEKYNYRVKDGKVQRKKK